MYIYTVSERLDVPCVGKWYVVRSDGRMPFNYKRLHDALLAAAKLAAGDWQVPR